MSEQYRLGQIEIEDFVLATIGSGGIVASLDLKSRYSLATISQSIFNNTMTLTVTFVDGTGAYSGLSKIGIQAQEIVFVNVRTPPDVGYPSEYISQQFAVQSVESELDQTGNGMLITLYCKEINFLLNMTESVNQSFNERYHNVAYQVFDRIKKHPAYKSVLKDFGNGLSFNTPKIDVHETDNREVFIIPGLDPFAAMEMLARRSFRSKTLASMYVFYQRQGVFCFHNVEQLISEGLEGSKRQYRWDPSGQFNFESTNYLKINHFEVSNIDNTSNITRGAYKNSVRSIDLVRQTYTDIKYNYKDEFSRFANLGANKIVSDDYLDNFCGEEYEYIYYLDSSKRNQVFPAFMGRTLSYFYTLGSLTSSIRVAGDTTVKPGMVIDVSMSEQSGITIGRAGTKLSGSWFVQGVNHSFTPAEHVTTLSCSKNGIDIGSDLGGGDF